MENKTLKKWDTYWSSEKTPSHRSDSASFLNQHSGELKLLYLDYNPQSVLEIGCGTGSLYIPLGFDKMHYKGVDFSESMLSEFRSKHPQINVVHAEASTFCDNSKYDMIFANAVIQFFEPAMLDAFLANARLMMKPGSLLVCASVPWRTLRASFLRGELTPPYSQKGYAILRSYASAAIKGMGQLDHWYNLIDFKRAADKHDMTVNFYGGISYLYRFHAVMTLRT
jgi:trans-aconitate methyltransferase